MLYLQRKLNGSFFKKKLDQSKTTPPAALEREDSQSCDSTKQLRDEEIEQSCEENERSCDQERATTLSNDVVNSKLTSKQKLASFAFKSS